MRAPDRRQYPTPEGLDAGIAKAVDVLMECGVETFESCEGGGGHSYPEPTVRFHGQPEEGFRAYAAAMERDLKVTALRRTWVVEDGELHGPYWELVFQEPQFHDSDSCPACDAAFAKRGVL